MRNAPRIPSASYVSWVVRATPVVDTRGEYARGPIVQRSAPQAAAAQRAYIDPKTRRLIDRPADADPVAASKTSRDVDYTVRATPEGYLYIDTSNLRAVSRATLGEDGRVELSCGLDHDHAEDAK